jgi:hypothetical protein
MLIVLDNTVIKAEQIVSRHNNVLGGRFVELKRTDEIEFGRNN